jgi:hypothetical protein
MSAILPALVGILALTVGDGEIVHTPAAAAKTTAAPKPCSAPEHRQFDFWLGEWEVREDGKVAGSNRITRILGGCALREEWAGAGGSNGTSLNTYDATTRRWHQTWVDDKGNVLLLQGERAGGKMVLEGDRPVAPGKIARHRISWTPLSGGRVRQLWESSNDTGKSWEIVFDGTYLSKKG